VEIKKMANFMQQLVRGFTWKCKMSNDAIFAVWTPTDLSRAEAEKLLLEQAGYYQKGDIVSIWKCIGLNNKCGGL
jgi:hypothetical protein